MYFESKKKCSLLRVLIVVPVIFMTETSENTLRSPQLDGRKIDTSTCTLPNYMYFGSEKKSSCPDLPVLAPVIFMTGTPENTLRSPFLGGQKIDHKYMYFDGHREISKSSKKNYPRTRRSRSCFRSYICLGHPGRPDLTPDTMTGCDRPSCT